MANPLMGMISQELFNDAQLHRFTAAEEGILDGIREKLKGISKNLKDRKSDPMPDGVEAVYNAKYKANVDAIRSKIIKDVQANAKRIGIDPHLQELTGGNGAEIDCIGYDFKDFANNGYWQQMDQMPKELRCPEQDTHGDRHLDWETKAVHWLSEQLFADVVKKYDRDIKRVYGKAQVTYDVFSDSPNMVTCFIWFDKSWLEDQVPKAVAQESFQKGMTADDFLAAYESYTELKAQTLGSEEQIGGLHDPGFAAMEAEVEALHQGLEDTLQQESAPYDPTEELENITQVLAGVDDGSDEPEQQDEESDVAPQDNIENLMATPTDTDQAAGAVESSLRVKLNNFKNRKLITDHQDFSKYPKYPSIQEMIGAKVKQATVHNVPLTLDGSFDDFESPDAIKEVEKLVGDAAKVKRLFLNEISDKKGKYAEWMSPDEIKKITTSGMTIVGVRIIRGGGHTSAEYTYYHPGFGDHIGVVEYFPNAKSGEKIRSMLDG